MLSIRSNVFNEFYINKSRFITFLYCVDSLDDVKTCINDLQLKYKDATHICFAYIIDSVMRFSDDGEPSGTAGMPILNVLQSKNLDHVLCCVVRYFGGIKLGANGLVRAYSSSCSECVDLAEVVCLIPGKRCLFSFDYSNTKIVDSLLKDCFIINKNYDSFITYEFKIDCDSLSCIENELFKYGNLSIIDDCFVELKNW